jgi:hypothetical protein
MAKSKSGLPEGFNLSVSSNDLVGKPVQVGGYLDEDPMLELLKIQRQMRASTQPAPVEISAPPPQAPPMPEPMVRADIVASTQPVTAQPQFAQAQVQLNSAVPMNQDYSTPPAPRERRVRAPIRRLQINLTPDSERQVNELIEIISSQSAEKNIMFSEILNALIHNLYEARADLNVSRVPLRGRWGAPTAKSFPIALAQAFKEAIIAFGMKNGTNQFKKVVGG